MKHKFLFAITISSLLAACAPQPTNTKPAGIEGRTKRETISVSSKISGRVLKIFVSEGDVVKRGDTLALLDLPEVESRLQQAQGAFYSADAQYQMSLNGATDNQIKQLEAKQAGFKEQFDFAKTSFDRVKNMYADSLIPRQKYDEAYAKYTGAKAQLDAVNAELDEAKRGVRVENKQAAYGQKERAQGAVKEASIALSERYVIAPEDMSIETIALHTGELAIAGYTLFSGYISNTTYFRFTVPESSINEFKVGDEATILLPFMNNKTIAGKVLTIKQLNRYAEVSTAFPTYEMGESIYELKIAPVDVADASTLLANSTAILQ